MAIRVKRKLIKAGQSNTVTLPSAWVAFYGNRGGEVTIMGSDLLLVVPAGLEQRAEQVMALLEGRDGTAKLKEEGVLA